MTVSSIQHVCVVSMLLGGIWVTPTHAQSFRRGDFNGDTALNSADIVGMLNFFWEIPGAALPGNACGAVTYDAVDVNDNEYLTIADALHLAGWLWLVPGIPIPPPTTACGIDSTTTTSGFNVTDPAFEIVLGTGIAIAGGVRARYPLFVDTPVTLMGYEVYFNYPVATLSNPTFTGTGQASVAAPSIARVSYANPLLDQPIPPGFSFLGHLDFDLVGGVVPTIGWQPDFTGAFFHRATVIDEQFQDHHPSFQTQTFDFLRRGDSNGDGAYDFSDVIAILNHLAFGTPLGSVCTSTESADVNDNEHITIADSMVINHDLFCGGTSFVFSGDCGVDADDSARGFGVIDTGYQLTASAVIVTPITTTQSSIDVIVGVRCATPIRGAQFALRLEPGISLATVPLTVSASATASVGLRIITNEVVFLIQEPNCGQLLPASMFLPGGGLTWQTLGTLHLMRTVTTPSNPSRLATWLPSPTIGGVEYRASLVDDDYLDHHPVLAGGEQNFTRGDVNQLSGPLGPVDIADPIYLLTYLFPPPYSTPLTLACVDAADADNSGAVDIGDAIFLLCYLTNCSGSSTGSPPAPIFCGLDTDIDPLGCMSSNCP